MALTQKEIDDLINEMMQKSEVEQKPQVIKPKLRVYDFRRPDKFSKDQVRGTQLLFDNFCRQLTSYFSGLFRLAIHANVSSVDQITYQEFARELTNPCCVAVLDWKGLPSSMLVDFSLKVALPMVDRLCGGSGNTSVISRSLTEIETAVFRRVVQAMSGIFSETLKDFNVGHPEINVTSLEVNPLFVQQAMAPNDVVLSVAVSLKFGSQTGNITFCLPYAMLEPILPALSAYRWFSRNKDMSSKENDSSASTALKNVEVSLSCVLGNTTLPARDVLSLRPGDILELNTPRNGFATLNIFGKPKFLVRIGRSGKRLAARVEGLVPSDEEV